ncbi:uncharacterized protein MELLADRAFT_68481 [Melampsora larici-populina 98AG31]|uniref:Uncharacterized protein n=1 Tax=Melampsora larici-populina (strain 98AG31 / pathotype 3-4-7) TaxID=747676 RepID=F4S6Y7_MELLP|nr:uncharacterized protein MELLADRAFT_68481 [Melampsora larici-populina 98AG31]EGF99541.1 hypothetical protein MELLADRAFT_68481 [Melampsora larici-populina 98AG31]
MPRGNKKIGECLRKVCTCKAFNCKSGFYLDAQGSSQLGVELSPEAYEAHQQAELRNIAQAASSVDALEHSFQDINFGSSSEDNQLVEILRELRVSPASQSSPSRSGEAVNPAQVPNQSSREHDEDVILESSRTCPAIDTEREVGSKVYDTGEMLLIHCSAYRQLLTQYVYSNTPRCSLLLGSWMPNASQLSSL